MSLVQVGQYRTTTRSPLGVLRQASGLPIAGKLAGITIVSAFTDPAIIEAMLDDLVREGSDHAIVKVCLDFGASGYHRDDKVTDQLDALAARLTDGFGKDSGIYLINMGRFLHSKVFILHTRSGDKVSVGSLNLTRRGFFTNEEILTNITDAAEIASVRQYTADLFANDRCQQVPFDGVLPNGVNSSSRQWLLQGALFFEDKAASPFNFKLCLPAELLKQPAVIIPGAPAEVSDNISLMQLLGIPDTKSSLAWKKYCVPTCYGYWCPSQLSVLARHDIQSALAEKHKTKIEPVLQSEDALTKKFHALFNKIERNIKKFNDSHNTRHVWNKSQAITRLEHWIPRNVERLKDKDNLYRLLAGVNETIMPDFWAGDEIALRKFEESFCIHLVLELSKARVLNWVALWLRDQYAFAGGDRLGSDWQGSWEDEQAWLEWLRGPTPDPFAELPAEWADWLVA